jgi:hypothetical protein
LAAVTALTSAAKGVTGTGPEEAIVVLVEALVVEVVAGMVDEGFGVGVAATAVDDGVGTVASEVDEVAGDAGELRAVAPLPLHPPRVNRGSEIETAVRSQ